MSLILSDMDRIGHAGMDDCAGLEPACTADACDQGRKPCPCPEACRVAPRERRGNPSRLMQALLDPYERAALTAGLALLGWVLLIAFGSWGSA
ncbi:hypothetical protein J7U46_09725 [Pelomonas sp. V22]|uniref:hypothetical protein n=1 Tax=Pelomonas sp. V22 TaxID=2822139 RepID=UPI0024A9D261|nr:hypothetical protein [Pelomonas sp. V22]MDI4633325.1 hypothetical protein [Pelomonas sp. V22]